MYAQPDVLLENEVMPGWFATYGTPFRRGRDFEAAEADATAPVAIVNLAYERKFLDGRSAVGEVVDSRTVVGVVADAAFVSPRDGMRPTVYVPFSMPDDPEDPRGTRVTISLRSAGAAPVTLARGAATALAAVDPLLTFTFRSVADDVAASIARERVMATLSAVFAALVLPLAALGLYGVTAYTVNRERRRIGLQLALGSTPGGVLRRVMSTVCVLVLAGTLAGVAGSLLVGRVVSASLYGIEPHDTPSLLGAALVTTAVSLIAGWFPARRAASIDPAELLRSE